MLLKNRLLIALCIQILNIFYINCEDNQSQLNVMKDNVFKEKNYTKISESNSNQEENLGDYNKDYKKVTESQTSKDIEAPNLTEDISSWKATKAILRNAGRNIIGPVIETTLGVIKYGLQRLSNSLEGDANKERRDNIYMGTAGALAAWTLYRWSQGNSIIPYGDSVKSWWNDTAYPNVLNFTIKNKKNNELNVNVPPKTK